MDQESNNGRMPIEVLNQLNEYTVGGFILFYFNSKEGSPEHVMSFDTTVHSLAMQNYLNNCVDALRQLNIENAKNQLNSYQNPPDESDESNEEE
jgi:hypothetical protein